MTEKPAIAPRGLNRSQSASYMGVGATIAAENGASEFELMSMYGWANPKQAAHYTKKASRKKLAASGSTKLRLADQR